MPKILYLLDGHAIAYRAYFALTSGGSTRWATSSGEPTAGIYGFASMLLKLLEQEEPDYLAVSFDTGKTFRHEMYSEYKGTRAKMPDDLRSQIGRIREMVDAFNIPRIEVENFEADDVIGSLANWATTKEGLGVKIITGDRDLLQLVNNRIVVALPNKSGSNDDYFAEDVGNITGIALRADMLFLAAPERLPVHRVMFDKRIARQKMIEQHAERIDIASFINNALYQPALFRRQIRGILR